MEAATFAQTKIGALRWLFFGMLFPTDILQAENNSSPIIAEFYTEMPQNCNRLLVAGYKLSSECMQKLDLYLTTLIFYSPDLCMTKQKTRLIKARKKKKLF